MSIVTVKKNTYTVEPLYQWDKNQTLQVFGLSLPSIPEVHFTNAAIDRAIVRQASMDASGVVSADIPNSLLQKPYTVTAYICIYTGDTFETLYKIEVPVKQRQKPGDYTLENDTEVYSFDALENQVANVLQKYGEVIKNYDENTAAYRAMIDRAEILESLTSEAVEKAAAAEESTATSEAAATGAQASAAAAAASAAAAAESAARVDTRARFAYGSYVGTGTYGESNPNTLTFDFVPKFLMMNYGVDPLYPRTFFYGQTVFTHYSEQEIHMTWGESSISWWDNSSASSQMNDASREYYYIALG